MRKIGIAIIVSVSLLVLDAFGCTCGEMSVRESRNLAKVVFLGKVVSKKLETNSKDSRVEITLQVERVWKGDVSERIIVFTDPGEKRSSRARL